MRVDDTGPTPRQALLAAAAVGTALLGGYGLYRYLHPAPTAVLEGPAGCRPTAQPGIYDCNKPEQEEPERDEPRTSSSFGQR
jgi:hypothetical protein